MATLLLITVKDNPNANREAVGDINSVTPISLLPKPPDWDPAEYWDPLPPVGQVPGNAGTDPRGRGAGTFVWAVVTDKEPTDAATAAGHPELQNMGELDDTWQYKITTEEIQTSPKTRQRYTTDNISETGQYAFTAAYLEQKCADFDQYFIDRGYTCTRVNNAATTVVFEFKNAGGGAIPSQDLAEVRAVMEMLLSQGILKQRRWNISAAGLTAISNATPDAGILIDTWANISAYIEDGYKK